MRDPVTALMAEMGAEILDRVNADYEDSLVLIGRVLGGQPDTTAVRAVDFDSRGVELVITATDGTHPARIEFAQPITEARDMTTALFALAHQARALSGEEGQTSAEREMTAMAAVRTFSLTEVVAVREINPHLREVTFGGGDLAEFAALGPDTFVLVLPSEDQSVGAYYTVRRWRPAEAALDVLMVLHDGAGAASVWAARAQPGDRVALRGPRDAYHPPLGTDRVVLVADETGVPAVAVILEQLAPGTPATVVAEVASEAERQALPIAPETEVVWLYRDGAAAGTTTLLVDAVHALPTFEGTPYVWGGAESRAMAAVRRYVRQERGLPREAVSLFAYWRHDRSDGTREDSWRP